MLNAISIYHNRGIDKAVSWNKKKIQVRHAFTIIPMLHFCSAFWSFHVLANAVMHWWDGSIRTYKLSMPNFVDIRYDRKLSGQNKSTRFRRLFLLSIFMPLILS